MDIKKLVLIVTLENAIRYNGKADVNSVVSKIMGENPSLKKQIKEVIKTIVSTVAEVNLLSEKEQREKLEKLRGAEPKKEKEKVEETNIFSFFKIKKGEKVVTAFPPEPSKYAHIGHAKALLINYELAKRYNGEFVLRFEDNNPELVKEEYYKNHIQDYQWLGVKWDKLDYVSDYIEEMYKQAEKLIKLNKAYTCFCSQSKIRDNRANGKECKCRSFEPKTNLEEWKDLLKEGNYVLRLKINVKHQNTSMRDPIIMRVVTAEHPRVGKKYRVWPTYDFATSVMDGLENITHRIRTKEFELRRELHNYIQKLLEFKPTNIYEMARFNIKGAITSGRIIREKIEKKELSGWDDPSLTTLIALRKRGFLPEAIKNFVISTGITKTEATLSWDDLIVQNRRLLDFNSNRYFFVENPKKIKIKNAPSLVVEVPLHPNDLKRGYRKFETENEFYIADKLGKNKCYRFISLFNFKNKEFISIKLEPALNAKLVQWLPVSKDLVNVDVIMPDNKKVTGFAEPSLKRTDIGATVQLVRFGFCKLYKKDGKKLIFYFTHK